MINNNLNPMEGEINMSKKFMKLTVFIITSQLVGCTSMSKDELKASLDTGQMIQVEVMMPDGYEEVTRQKEGIDWVQLDKQVSYDYMRSSWDDTLKIIPYGQDSKNGVFYMDESGKQTGNSVMRTAFRNKVFMTKYWGDASIKASLAEAVTSAYADEGESETSKLMVGLNGYFSILPDYQEGYGNENAPLTRGEFLASVYRAETLVPNDTTAFTNNADYSGYAEAMIDFSYLNHEDESLNEGTLSGSISRGEAVYTLMKKYFPEKLKSADGKAANKFSDCLNAGDIAHKRGYIETDKTTGKDSAKKYWKSYELEYSIQHADMGAPEQIFLAMQVANELGIIEGETCRWDEALTKGEMMSLLIKVYEAENNEYGYLLNAEYGEGEEFNTSGQNQDNESKVGDEIQNGGLSDTAGNGGAGETDLKAIFDPYIFADLDNMTVNPTPDMYSVMGAFGITPETHDIDKIMEEVMIEVLDNSETITSDDIAKAIEDYGEVYKKESQPEANPAGQDQSQGQTENQSQGQTGGGDQSQQPAKPQQPDVQPQQPAQPQAPAEAQPSGGDDWLDPEAQALFDSTPGAGYNEGGYAEGSFNAN